MLPGNAGADAPAPAILVPTLTAALFLVPPPRGGKHMVRNG